MSRFVVVLALLLVVSMPARGQSPFEVAKTAALIESWQNPDGGFGSSKGGKSSLGGTSGAIRMLKNVGGSIPDIAACRAYVNSCFDPKSGGFANEPGGKPGVGITASGLMAVGELGTTTDEMVKGAIDYFHKAAKSFEDIRIAVAGLEAIKKSSPDSSRWIAEILADRNDDGTWGKGGEQAFATGSRVAAILRMGGTIEKKDAVVAAMKAGQRPDGGWSKDGKDSDLGSTYRIMRSFFMMNEKPDLEAVRSYLMKHKQDDGAYASKPGASDGGGTYFVTTVNRWVRLLSGEPVVVETAGFTPLFDGKTLSQAQMAGKVVVYNFFSPH